MGTHVRKSEALQAYESQKRKLTAQELMQDYLANSDMGIKIENDWTGNPLKLVIVLRGKLASLPSIKNSKRMTADGHLIINSDYRARLKALDALFFQKIGNRNFAFGKTPVWCSVVCGKRKVRFDSDNCFSSITDWLEPSVKGVKNQAKQRGWGVGIINDDAQLTGICLKAEHLGLLTTDTIIVVSRWIDEGIRVIDFMSSVVNEYQQIK